MLGGRFRFKPWNRAAIDDVFPPVDRSRSGRGQERHQIGNFHRLCRTTDGNAAQSVENASRRAACSSMCPSAAILLTRASEAEV